MLLISASYIVIPKNDVILPPLSSKVPKFVLEESPRLGEIIKSRKKYKEFSLSPLMLVSKKRYLYSTGENDLLKVRRGEKLSFTFSIAAQGIEQEVFEEIPRESNTPYGEFYIEIEEVSIVEQHDVRFQLDGKLNIRFETPTLLSTKNMLPPSVKNKKSIPNLNRLIPQPSLIFSFLAKMWNSIAEPKDLIVLGNLEWTPYYIGRISDVLFAETGFSIKPLTVIIGKDDKGVLRRTRGFVGWVKYDYSLPRKYREIVERLLGLATIFGVGRSRGIGFGRVKVENVVEGNRKGEDEG
ncbi:MAG: CRISPR system precrRNA processing endoribonuclease RAMP protein Cas6 [Sulfolobaceae archaeon]|nr:CRISPR system precrRNA processing endoribonuclease RAMP protein Cas6 [Sulfolobaceae archaeon]